MSVSNSSLQGMRVLVAEDELLVSMLLEEMLGDLGCLIDGPYASVADALQGAKSSGYDVALIDINLAGEKADQVILEAVSRGAPIAITSGNYTPSNGVTPDVILDKPYSAADLERAMHTLHSALVEKRAI